jgi:hypothetical protein
MFGKILHFIKYNNAFTLMFVLCFFGVSAAYAATEGVPDSLYASATTVVAIDNGALLAADLNNFDFALRINAVTDDEKNYYADYSYHTFVVENGVWQVKDQSKTLTINKEALGDHDLGLYIAEELGENINAELAYLQRVQKLEREKGESNKVVTVEYSGLIGKILDPKTMEIEGYDPVIPEPTPETKPEYVPDQNPQDTVVSTPYVEKNTPAPADTTVDTPPTLPAPQEMIDEHLVQEVVGDLLDESTTTPERAPEPVVEPVVEPATP